MELKQNRDIRNAEELFRIVPPFEATTKIKNGFYESSFGLDRIDGIDRILSSRLAHNNKRNQNALDWILEGVIKAEILLLQTFSSDSSRSVIKWQQDEHGTGRWVSDGMLDLWAKSNIENLIRMHTPPPPKHAIEQAIKTEEASLYDKVIGGAKQFVNEIARDNAAKQAEWMAKKGIVSYQGTGGRLTPEQIAERTRQDGKDLVSIKQNEQSGADIVKNLPQTPAIVGAVAAVTSHGKSIARDPAKFAKAIKQAVTNSRSPSEALGKYGMEQAKKRQGHTTDSRYVDRYHGPDDITRKDGKLAEWEAKGTKTDSTAVAKDKYNNKQVSAAKNKRRAQLMIRDKAKKIGQPSNRQGGTYTKDEVNLWSKIKKKKGHKKHISTHTNTTTGRVLVIERDHTGNMEKLLDDLQIENFEEVKNALGEAFKK